MKLYTLIGPDGTPYKSSVPGTLGGHRRNKGYGRLDCRSALRWIAKGYYVKHRVFFADEATAIEAGYRPCATCMKEQYTLWKQTQIQVNNKKRKVPKGGKMGGRGRIVSARVHPPPILPRSGSAAGIIDRGCYDV